MQFTRSVKKISVPVKRFFCTVKPCADYVKLDADRGWRWVRDQEAEDFAMDLCKSKTVIHQYGIETTTLKFPFGFDLSENPMLVTKRSTRLVYNRAIELCSKGDGAKVLLEGAQGIGKSRSLIYILKGLLLKNINVVYIACKLDLVYLFVHSESGYR